MNRPLTALFAALEAAVVVGIGVGLALAPLTALWALQYDLQIDWTAFYRTAVDAWLLGHGVDVQISAALPVFGGAAGTEPFTLTLAALGFALLTVLLGVRAGRRLLETDHPVVAVTASLGAFALLAAVLTLTAGSPDVQPSRWQGVLLPTLVFATGLLVGAVLPGPGSRRRVSSRQSPLQRLADSVGDSLPPDLSVTLSWAMRLGGMTVAAVLAVAAVLVGLLLVLSYSQVVTLYESLQGGVLGGLTLTLGQLALLPNLILWAAAWLIGPGFAIGAGSSVSPLGTALGPIPTLPVLGALPTETLPFGFVGIAVPVVLAFIAASTSRGRVDGDFGGGASLGRLIGIGLLSGAFAGLLLGLLTWAASGAAGPGRLVEVGASPLAVGAAAAVEAAVATTLGLLAGRRALSGTHDDDRFATREL